MKKPYEVGCRVSMAYEEQTVNELTQRETLIVISNKTTTIHEITRRILGPTSILFFPSRIYLTRALQFLSKLFLFAAIKRLKSWMDAMSK